MDQNKASLQDEETDGSISSVVFNFSRKDQIQFEVATSGVLSAAALATAPPNLKGQIIQAAALMLPALAVFHWSVNTSRFSNEDFYFAHTYRIIEFLGIIVVFHIIHFSVSLVLSELPIPIGAPIANLIGVSIFALFCVVFIELIYKGYLLFWGTAFYIYALSVAENAENPKDAPSTVANLFLHNFSAQLSYRLLKNNIPEGDSVELDALRNFVSEVESDLHQENNLSLSRLFLTGAIIVVPVFGVIAYLLSASIVMIPFLDVVWILAATRLTKHVIEVPALIFGTLSFPDFLQTNLKSLLTITLYTTCVYLLFFA